MVWYGIGMIDPFNIVAIMIILCYYSSYKYLYYIIQIMFFGIFFLASLGAAGVLSAIAAADPANEFENHAQSYLIGTSVSCLSYQNRILSPDSDSGLIIANKLALSKK